MNTNYRNTLNQSIIIILEGLRNDSLDYSVMTRGQWISKLKEAIRCLKIEINSNVISISDRRDKYSSIESLPMDLNNMMYVDSKTEIIVNNDLAV